MRSKAWDKFLLLVVAIAVIALSALFAMRALAFGERFGLQSAVPNNELPETDEGIAVIARSFVEKSQIWINPMKGDPAKPVPLFVSIPIVEANGMIIDMLDPNAPQLRSPVSNAWLLSNNLDFLNSGVLSQDPDGDGFTNLEEWEAKTDPLDPQSRPPYVEKLIFASRQQESYILRFRARPDPETFHINRLESVRWPKRDDNYLKLGDLSLSKDGQFRLESFEEKRERNNLGIEADKTELTITYLPTGETHVLVRDVDYTIPTYFAEMKFELDPQFQKYVKEGETFSLTVDPETKYRVAKVNADSVIIVYQTGAEPEQTVEIPKK